MEDQPIPRWLWKRLYKLRIRYRIDGELIERDSPPRRLHAAIISRIKVMATIDISEKRKPQDGSFGAKLQARDLDFRVATSGSKAGEKLVMRILDNSAGITKLEDLGMRSKLVEQVRGR